jgi:hypothetical protein
MKSQNGYLLLFVFVFTVILNGCADSGEKSSKEVESEQAVQKFNVSLDLSGISELSEGDTLSIMKNETDERYHLVIRRVQETFPGIMSISANVEDKDTGLATLIYRDGHLSGFMDMYKSNIRWEVNYDSVKNSYYLTEIDPEDIDEMEGGEALTPPNEQY